MRGKCVHCGTDCEGERIAGSVYLFSCPTCNAEMDDLQDAAMARIVEEFGDV